jgi:glutathione reductase (NADPH)
MATYDYDLFVLGAGSGGGGVRASRISAGLGARVAVAEERRLGGTCVNVGCIPKKLLVYASHYREAFEDAAGYGWRVGESSFDWPSLIAAKDREIGRLNDVYAQLLSDAGVEVIEGRARISDPHSVIVGEQRYTAGHILVATGSWPRIPEVPGSELAITSNEAFHLQELPERALIVGGGYIAVEFAGILHGLGSEVTQLYRGPLFLRGFDGDVRRFLADEMRKKEIDLRFEVNVEALERSAGGLRSRLTDGSILESDVVLFATGRVPLTADLGLEEVGVKLAPNGAVIVDALSCSSIPSIHAVGDATDRINLTPVALHEGVCLAQTLFGGRPTPVDHESVPSAVFSQPPIGQVGLTEEDARERYGEIDVYRSEFRPLLHTLSGRSQRCLMKLVVDRGSQRVLGVHVVGEVAGEIVQGFAVAVKMGATKAQLDATIGIHPTAAEELVTLRA